MQPAAGVELDSRNFSIGLSMKLVTQLQLISLFITECFNPTVDEILLLAVRNYQTHLKLIDVVCSSEGPKNC